MGQPVKISDSLVEAARMIAPYSHRSIAGQIEFWASLGKALEPLLRGDSAMSIQKAGTEKSLSESISEVDTPKGRKQLQTYLSSRPYPRYVPVDGQPTLVRRIGQDGSETIGRFVGRNFKPIEGKE